MTSARCRGVVLGLGLYAIAVGAALLTGLVRTDREALTTPTFAEERPVTATDQLRSPAHNSPTLVADPTNERLVAMASRIDWPDFGCRLHLSGDGGQQWVPVDPVPTLPEGADKCYGPEVAFDKNGTLYFLFVGLHTSGNVPMGAFLATSSNQGRTFSAPQRVLGPRNFGVRMAIDPTLGEPVRIHFVWLHSGTEPGLGSFPAGRNPILSAYSDDGGNSLSEPVQVSDPRRARVVAPALALGPDRAVHIAYYDLQGDARDYQGLAGPVWEGTWSVVATTSTDGGRSFGPSLSVDEQVVPSERPILIFTMPPPALAAGRRGVCAAWTDSRHGDPDILARCSDDAGRHWDALQRVNDDPVGNGATQYLPRLSAAPDGRLDAVFLDRRYDPLNTDNDVSYTHSFDGGRTFAPVSRISSSSWSPRIGPEYAGPAARGKVEIGSRLGLLSGRAGVVAAWADTRYPVGRRPRGQSIYSRSLELSPPTGASWRQPLGVVVLLAGVAALGGAVRRDPDDGGDR